MPRAFWRYIERRLLGSWVERELAVAAQIIVSGFTCLAEALMLRVATWLSPLSVGALLAPVSKWTAVTGFAVVALGLAVAAAS